MNIKKISIFVFFISFISFSGWASSLDGTWKGTISLGEGRIDYDLTLTIKTEGTQTLVEAKTNYAKLQVTYVNVEELTEGTHIDIEAYELTQDVYFNFTLMGALNEAKDTIQGSASQIIQNRRYLTSYGTFEVKKVLF
ncbi:MAG: hypothetical protein A2Z91_08860 [Deltaproteobacteria bacterium GWA2_38_16]|nr:MAG: hypothetical protein A2Z91_08860 [Deltaproteobacteria bacterium GWA2_38_16]OGQ03904.1 MAG: hypothetical protein A3D19_07425 [Deltaproteobacteria bacterium RIFCSPHIGHO2_02_FULL_38_15]OGQ34390.1 MAG: hypothetical protein A3A72_09335 [Deltaproteobacteria bacterium RIFCSPLOWO2_01_FULL_38_9]OGQ59943.1 MAG: hypothetical protein A3G92_03140 [Deltaproteobacteria bacterium RIFCSPLOWO2_12_FULL_38_8]HBQ20951.1 hypothetical protein [Deltaproteobacteria bacterium]